MNLSDIKVITATDIKTYGNAIIEATIENVYALDVLQAEYRAETHLAKVAEANAQVVSADRWETVKAGDGNAETWTIRFFCA